MLVCSRLKFVCLALISLLLVACAASSERMQGLDRTLRNYQKTIRWADFDTAYTFRKWEKGAVQAAPAALKNVRVTRYEVGNSNLSPDKNVFTQVVRISYYLMDSAREKQLVDKQRWEYDEKSGRWLLTSELPAF